MHAAPLVEGFDAVELVDVHRRSVVVELALHQILLRHCHLLPTGRVVGLLCLDVLPADLFLRGRNHGGRLVPVSHFACVFR